MSSSVPSHSTESIADRRKQKELAEARQSGQVAPAVDVKTNTIINPHNPEFITKRPWYLGGGDEGPSLEHQAAGEEQAKAELSLTSADLLLQQERKRLKEQQRKQQFQVGMWVEALKRNRKPYRMCKIVKIAKKGKEFDLEYDDGTFERKVKFTPKRIRMTKKGNRTIDTSHLGEETYDAKRDKYHGYDQEGYMKRMEKVFSQREEKRRKMREEAKQKQQTAGNDDGKMDEEEGHRDSDSDFDDSDVGSDDSDDEFVQKDEAVFTSRLARQGGVGGAQMKVTARNLRIREDTAKYLRNLNPNSAYYDPKSRSMRDNPNPEAEDGMFAGDNFARISGDAVGLADTQLFAWDAADKGIAEIHPQADPSQAELLKKQFQTKSADLRVQQKKAVLDKYGGEEYLDGQDGLAAAVDATNGVGKKQADTTAAARKARFGVSTAVEEYTRDGRLVKGNATATKQRVALKSKYEEDVLTNGHWTVWGSYFHKGAFRWGYADDHSLMKSSYCTGDNGRKANDEANEMRYGTGKAGSAALAQAREMLKTIPVGERSSSGTATRPTMSKMYGEADPTASYDQDKLKKALRKEDQSREETSDDRKRKYNSVSTEVDVTEEEMEAYRMRKDRGSDPMAKLADSEELLEYK